MAMEQQGLVKFKLGISLVLFWWTAFQMAVEDEPDRSSARNKVEQFTHNIFFFFISKRETDFDDEVAREGVYDALIDLLAFELYQCFESDLDDDTISDVEDVAYTLMEIYDHCLEGDYEFVEGFKEGNSQAKVALNVNQAVNCDGDDGPSDMMVDASNSMSNSKPVAMIEEAEQGDGWVKVVSKKNRRGKKFS